MGRKLLIGPVNVINETGLDTTKVGEITSCEQVDELFYVVKWSNGNTPVMEAIVEFSFDKTTWYQLDFASTISISGASGDHKIKIDPNFNYVRPTINVTSGDCDLVVTLHATTRGA